MFVADFDFRFFDRYGRKNGFTCYVLRYFLLLNHNANLSVTMNEFMVAIATLFHAVELPRYQSLVIAPTSRCVTMFNWLQVFMSSSVYKTLPTPDANQSISPASVVSFRNQKKKNCINFAVDRNVP